MWQAMSLAPDAPLGPYMSVKVASGFQGAALRALGNSGNISMLGKSTLQN